MANNKLDKCDLRNGTHAQENVHQIWAQRGRKLELTRELNLEFPRNYSISNIRLFRLNKYAIQFDIQRKNFTFSPFEKSRMNAKGPTLVTIRDFIQKINYEFPRYFH